MSEVLNQKRAWRLFGVNVGLTIFAFALFLSSHAFIPQIIGAVLISWVWISSLELLLTVRRLGKQRNVRA